MPSNQKSKQRRKAIATARHSAVRKQLKKPDPKSGRPSYSSLLPGSWQLNAGVSLLFVLATAALYAGDLHLGFFRIDDQQYVVTNRWIQGVSSQNLNHILTSPYYANYSPVHLFSYMLDYAIAGLNAYAFHLSSNIWAGIVAGCVYLVALALTEQRVTAVTAALLFVVHPVHVEAVAWISSRKDLVAAAFILPSLLAYLEYRKSDAKTWHIISILLFLFALLGKLSVAAFPAVLLALDLFVEKRALLRSLIDKIPYLIAAIIIAVAVAHVQLKSGVHPDVSVWAKAFAQSMWLLTGIGNYVIYRVRPEQGNILLEVVGTIILLALFLLPLLLRKRYPLAVVLIYWILFTFLPTQVLSFLYPVTDRYLFLPSVAAVILIAWLLIGATDQLQKWKLATATILVAAVSFCWVEKTFDYLSEWQDPRSVWFAAKEKSDDAQVYYNLGENYVENARSFGTNRRKAPLSEEEAKNYASVVWKDDPRLPQLLAELSLNQHNGPVENAFKEYLQNKAAENFDEAVAKKGREVMADLFLVRGVLFADKGEMQSAKKEYVAGIDEASRLTYSEVQQEVLVSCHYNLGVAEWTLGHYKEALSWMRIAEEEQDKLGRTLIPELTVNRKKLEAFVAQGLHSTEN